MKHVVITGGNKGLGLAQTETFVKHGFVVHVVARTIGDLVTSDQVRYVAHDLSNWRDTSYLDTVVQEAGRIDALVNNAGVHLKKPVWDVTGDELEGVLDINVKAMFAACGKYCDIAADQGGAIVNISSMGGLTPMAATCP